MLYPLLFVPIQKERIWGGQSLAEKYGRTLPADKIGESWDIACHPNGTSIVANGIYKGKTLKQIIEFYGKKILGSNVQDESTFPLLIKLLDASDVLSVQVHPVDEYARIHENGGSGKTEMWYVIDAKPDARLVYGIKPGITREYFAQALENGSLEECLNELEVQQGDVIYIPSGMVHAIGAGILICEIQQNSDTTYRVFDWNRLGDDGKPRELHIKKALDVIDFDGRHNLQGKLPGLEVYTGKNRCTYYVACKYFAMEKLDVYDSLPQNTAGRSFAALTVVEGSGKILYEDGCQAFSPGNSLIIPAELGEYKLEGRCTVIKAYVPHRELDIIEPLTIKGFTSEELMKIAGLFE